MLTTKKSTQNSGRLLRESKDGWKFREAIGLLDIENCQKIRTDISHDALNEGAGPIGKHRSTRGGSLILDGHENHVDDMPDHAAVVRLRIAVGNIFGSTAVQIEICIDGSPLLTLSFLRNRS